MNRQPLVIGIDSSTQSTKAIAWAPDGRCAGEGRADIPMHSPQIDWFEQQPAHWWKSCTSALQDLALRCDLSAVEGLAISNQRETVAFMGADDLPVYPAVLWLDGRSLECVKPFSEHFGAERLHRITGRPPDVTPCLYTYAWMREHHPQVLDRTVCFADVQAYLVRQLCGGPWRTGWPSADPMGLFDMSAKVWSPELLEALGLRAAQMPDAFPPGTELGRVHEAAARATGLPTGVPVYAGGGDGQCAGLGTNCTVPDRAYVNLGTAVVAGIWSPDYQYNRAWRTEIAVQGEGYIFETCLRSGAFLVDWFVDRFVARGRADQSTFDALEAAAMALPIGAEGLMLQPYFSGAMDPHWDSHARGVMLGLSPGHTEAHIYRAIIEGITLDQVSRLQQLERAAGQSVSHFVAIGGGARSPLWRQMLADASGKPVHVSSTVEASALGAGMVAAAGAGWYSSITNAARAMAGATEAIQPNAGNAAQWQELLDIHAQVYAATASINHRLVAFASRQRAHQA